MHDALREHRFSQNRVLCPGAEPALIKEESVKRLEVQRHFPAVLPGIHPERLIYRREFPLSLEAPGSPVRSSEAEEIIEIVSSRAEGKGKAADNCSKDETDDAHFSLRCCGR